jgi:hypothetical protein
MKRMMLEIESWPGEQTVGSSSDENSLHGSVNRRDRRTVVLFS